jgi:acetyl esterase/lipase
MNSKNLILCALISVVSIPAFGQLTIDLYDGGVPNSKESQVVETTPTANGGIVRVSGVTNPQITAFFPEKSKNTGKAAIIFPGGGYSILAIDHEGYAIAKRLNEEGINAFVVKYRLPSDLIMEDKSIGPLQDAQRAIQLVRQRAAEWGISSNEIGIVGSSAGGHLASTLGTHYEKALISNPDNVSLRPDFMLLLYPVISMDSEITHKGSQVNLLGENPSASQLHNFSNEKQVSADTPPTFIVHATDDKTVPIANSERFRDSLESHKVPVKLLVYPEGGHGFGLNNRTTDDQWFDHFIEWLNR